MTTAIQADGLVKRFKDTTALGGVSLRADKGTVLGVLGPNGAGKTTVIRILSTLLTADEGTVTINGHDVAGSAAQVRAMIGIAGQNTTLDEELTGTANLVLIGRLLGMSRREAGDRAARLLDEFGLADSAGIPVAKYSGGMRRRLDLAASIVGRPEVIFLDEPSVGLDPGKRNDLWQMIRELKRDGATILLTSQYLEEVDALADRVCVLDRGTVVAEGTPTELKQRIGGHTVTLRTDDPEDTDRAARLLEGVTGNPVDQGGNHQLTTAVDSDSTAFLCARTLQDEGIRVTEFSLRLPSLDDVFFALTGQEHSV